MHNVISDLLPLLAPIDSVEPLPGNPRRGDVESIKRSLKEFGQDKPIVVRRTSGGRAKRHGEVLAGNHTLRAAIELGWTEMAMVWRKDDERRGRARALADNRTSDLAVNEDALLLAMLGDIETDPALLDAISYSSDDIRDLRLLLAEPPAIREPDAVPDVPTMPRTKDGDVWLLGPHRLLCGDATDISSYERVLNGEHLAGAVVTDPPYGVRIGEKNRVLDSMDRAGRVLTDLDGDRGMEEVEVLWRSSFGVLAKVLPPGTPYYVFGPQNGDLGLLLLLLRDAGLAPRHTLIWVKNRPSFSIGKLDYDYQHEPIVYGWVPGGAHPWHASETRTSILPYDRPQASPLHPTMKPVALLAELVGNSTAMGGDVLDPFAGSGSTLIAAHGLNRRAYLLEIDPGYCDVICARFQAVTGCAPVLESTGAEVDFS